MLLALGWLLIAGAPWLLLAAARLLGPFESAVNRRFIASARSKLAAVQPLCIAVTGSYGKTMTKFCIGAVLAASETLVTPASYNSYLGVVRTINERLAAEHRAFVVEMGMFRRGDIAELSELVKPRIGVITAIGPMHLERLGSLEQIAAAKGELMEALPADGQLITNADDQRCLQIARRSHVPVVLFGIDSPLARVRANDIRMVDGRTRFELEIGPPAPGARPSRATVSAQLLGRHNVSNLLAAAAVGVALENFSRPRSWPALSASAHPSTGCSRSVTRRAAWS